jgi:hypothetical protein
MQDEAARLVAPSLLNPQGADGTFDRRTQQVAANPG